MAPSQCFQMSQNVQHVSLRICPRRLLRDGLFADLVLRFGPGHVFGEIALLTRAKRVADYKTTVVSRLAFLTRQGLAKLMKVEPELAARLLYNISQSLSLKMLQTVSELRSLKR